MSLKRTPFHGRHVAAGAKMIDFGGWDMPVQYTGTIGEHRSVREQAGLFDVSHMGEIRVRGPRALAALQHLVSNDVSTVAVGQSQYAALMNPDGGIVDDLFLYRLGDEDWLVCINAANREKDWAWFSANNPHGAEMEHQSDAWAQIALQGPAALAVADRLTGVDLAATERGDIRPGSFAGVADCLIARTGYTGEDGVEVFLPANAVGNSWERILAEGDAEGVVPVGLGARDTLRLEARNVLYGNDINDETSPLEAGLGWITKLNKESFVGKEALVAQRAAGLPRRLVGLVVEGRIARPHCPILNTAGEVIGEVTSGTRSPTLGTNIALGYVRAEHGNAKPGNALQVDVRGRLAPAVVVKGPFLER